MKFEGIEVYGFKSFADKASVSFQEGITAIVGPNGCGKSNVVDAIRWVLGEQSAKLLRGKTMQDVIFSGTERRKAMSYCEVTLRFNNAGPDRVFKTLEFDEVSITRKLFRNGNSEFYINGTLARLKDVRALIRETGLGREGYSIIGQDRIKEIVQAKPENRRAIFEDAAGVLGSKMARKEAKDNLEKYEINKLNIEALLQEMNRNLTSLERQSESAKKFLKIRDELMRLEANSYIYQKDNNVFEKKKLKDEIQGLIENIGKLDLDLIELNAKFEKNSDEQKDIDLQLNDVRSEQTALAVKEESIKGKGSTLNARKEGYLTTKEDYSRRLASLEDDLSESNRELRDNISKKAMAEEEKEQVDLDLQEAIKEQNRLMAEILEREQILETKNSEIAKLLESVGDIKENLGKIQAQEQATLDRIAEYSDEIEKLESEIKEKEEIREKLEEAVNDYKKDKDRLDATVLKLSNRYNELIDILEEQRDRAQELKSEGESLKSKILILEEIIKSHEGYAVPVQKLLKEADENPYVKSKIVGVVANLIKVPDEYQYAIEMALGANLQNIVVENEDDARDLIKYQREHGIGRITFLPLNRSKPRFIDPQCKGILNEKGVLGVASKLLSYNPRFENIISSMLGNTVICDSVDSANLMFKKYNAQVRVVSIEGDVFNTTGSIAGGAVSRNSTTGLLSQETKLKQFKEEYSNILKEYNELHESYASNKAEYEDLDEQIEEYEKEADDANEKYTKESTRYDAFVGLIAGLNNRLEEEKGHKKGAEENYAIINAALAKVNKANADIKDSREDVDGEAKARRDEFNKLKDDKKKVDDQVLDLKLQSQELKSKIDTYKQDIDRIEKDKEGIKKNIEDCKSILLSNDTNIKQTEYSMKNTIMSEEDKKRLREIEAVISKYLERKDELIEESKSISNKKDVVSAELLKLAEQKSRKEQKIISIDENMISLETKIKEDYDLDYDSALLLKDENFNYEESKATIKSLKAAKNSLGSVNVNAIEEYEIEKERYDKKYVEYEDILKAEEDCKKIIDDLSKEILEKFNAEFAKINANFQIVFKELFGGGTGNLVINEPDEGQDPLDAGVEIYAQPPGKRVQNMTLLSGGEQALTALAIMFAILRLRPMPFCVLDEVEAALDEGNVGIYAKYLKKFSNETQFILITHRKPTMEKSDILFGVTMQEKGVSKVVQVNLAEAVSHSTTEAQKFDAGK